ncbi:hypothetical protein HDU86_002603 [Geranomyces michiganensis]|nr:hypothetical protein HDU86_002603 [Geranomyces michiganensis]
MLRVEKLNFHDDFSQDLPWPKEMHGERFCKSKSKIQTDLEAAIAHHPARGAAGVIAALGQKKHLEENDVDLQNVLSLRIKKKAHMLSRSCNERTMDLHVWSEFYKFWHEANDNFMVHYGEARCESREIESEMLNNLDFLLIDHRGAGRRGTELAVGESVGSAAFGTQEPTAKILRVACASRDLCLKMRSQVQEGDAGIPMIFQNHDSAIAFTVRHLFANVVVANFLGEFQNPIIGGANTILNTLKGAEIFMATQVRAILMVGSRDKKFFVNNPISTAHCGRNSCLAKSNRISWQERTFFANFH